MSDNTDTEGAASAVRPSRVTLFIALWMAAFVGITAIQVAWGEVLATWPLPLRTLLVSGIMVLTIVGFVEPMLSRLLARRRPATQGVTGGPSVPGSPDVRRAGPPTRRPPPSVTGG